MEVEIADTQGGCRQIHAVFMFCHERAFPPLFFFFFAPSVHKHMSRRLSARPFWMESYDTFGVDRDRFVLAVECLRVCFGQMRCVLGKYRE